jgi:hypothetical protein
MVDCSGFRPELIWETDHVHARLQVVARDGDSHLHSL